MIRARFRANPEDYRPIEWPVKHPYWCTGYGEGYSIVVAYADDEAEIKRLWPEATNIDAEQVNEYTFTDRFPRPSWFGGFAYRPTTTGPLYLAGGYVVYRRLSPVPAGREDEFAEAHKVAVFVTEEEAKIYCEFRNERAS